MRLTGARARAQYTWGRPARGATRVPALGLASRHRPAVSEDPLSVTESISRGRRDTARTSAAKERWLQGRRTAAATVVRGAVDPPRTACAAPRALAEMRPLRQLLVRLGRRDHQRNRYGRNPRVGRIYWGTASFLVRGVRAPEQPARRAQSRARPHGGANRVS